MTSRSWTRLLFTRGLAARGAGARAPAIRSYFASRDRWANGIVAAIYAGCLTAFIADVSSVNTLAFGVFYTPLIVTAVFHRDKRAVWYLTFLACCMVVVGSFFPDVPYDRMELLENRALSIVALLATSVFVWHARTIQDRLARQTSRAEAAERIKTEVLTNLSQEIRAPLHGMIGVLELLAVGSRPDQKAALTVVRTSGRRLLETIDNLVDLTQFQGTAMPVQPVHLSQLLRRTAESRRQDAAARQINLVIAIPSGDDMMVNANPWALRRILENKIADGITYTAPGGRMEITTRTESGFPAAVITTTGNWPQGALQAADDMDAAVLVPSVMGLALSQRLAGAMGARLVFGNGPDGDGTTVTLQLPPAPGGGSA